jgi:hypothetical protein
MVGLDRGTEMRVSCGYKKIPHLARRCGEFDEK